MKKKYVVIALALAVALFWIARSQSLNWVTGHYVSSNDRRVLFEARDHNDDRILVFEVLDAPRSINYAVQNRLGFWRLNTYETLDDIKTKAWVTVILPRGFNHFEFSDDPQVEISMHMFYIGNDAIDTITHESLNVPYNTSAMILQTGSDYTIHLTHYFDGGDDGFGYNLDEYIP